MLEQSSAGRPLRSGRRVAMAVSGAHFTRIPIHTAANATA